MKPLYDSYILKPSLFLDGEKPRLIDEWQMYNLTWDLVKEAVDSAQKPNQFILTGSYSPKAGTTNHTGSMRIVRLNMTTMTLFEMGLSTGEVSLSDLAEGKDIFGTNPLGFEQITHLMVKGGYPSSCFSESLDSGETAKTAIDSVAETDIQEATGKALRPAVVRAMLRSLARNISTYAKNSTIMADIAQTESLSAPTFYEYYDGLIRLFVIYEIESWSPAIRSRDAIRVAPKRQFSDVSLAIAALGLSEEDLNKDPRTRGYFFENFVGHELFAYSESLGWKIGHYHDGLGLECDFTLHLPNGEYGLIEVKSGEALVPEAFKSLQKFDPLIDAYNQSHKESTMRKPSFKAVITGDSGFARRDPNGIYVIPVGVLRP
jgi:predicted AAA+ superfamily ATPase